MLYLIGIGLDKKDLTLKAIEAVKKCEFVYLDTFTSTLPCSVAELEKVVGKAVQPVDRRFVEEGAELIEKSMKANAALLVPGDPLSATTHVELLLRANKEGIKAKVIHGPSIFSAVAETGLQLYRFGKVASIPRWTVSYKPESFYDVVRENFARNAHTLLLLDIGLDVREALSYIKEILEKRKEKLEPILVCSRLGTEKAAIVRGKIDRLLKQKFELPACLIVPSPKLHFFEKEALKKFSKKA